MTSLRLKPMLCEICDKKKFLNCLSCNHKICLECKIAIKKIEPNPKCPFCRVLFNPSKKVIEEQYKQIITPFNIDQLIADVNWELYSGKKETEYDSELDEIRVW